MRDINRTFPAHESFKEAGDKQETLLRISKAYAVYDEEVGYCQGLSFLAASLLIHVSTASVQHELPCNLQRNGYSDDAIASSCFTLRRYAERSDSEASLMVLKLSKLLGHQAWCRFSW